MKTLEKKKTEITNKVYEDFLLGEPTKAIQEFDLLAASIDAMSWELTEDQIKTLQTDAVAVIDSMMFKGPAYAGVVVTYIDKLKSPDLTQISYADLKVIQNFISESTWGGYDAAKKIFNVLKALEAPQNELLELELVKQSLNEVMSIHDMQMEQGLWHEATLELAEAKGIKLPEKPEQSEQQDKQMKIQFTEEEK